MQTDKSFLIGLAAEVWKIQNVLCCPPLNALNTRPHEFDQDSRLLKSSWSNIASVIKDAMMVWQLQLNLSDYLTTQGNHLSANFI